MAPSTSVLLLDTAGRLDRELGAARGLADELTALLQTDSRGAFLTGAINAAMSTLRLLRRRMHSALAGAEVSIDVQESALRARMHVIVRAVYFLHRDMHAVPAFALGGRFRSVPEVTSYLADQVSQILAQWKDQRTAGLPLDDVSRRYASLDEAEVAFEALGRDPDLARFLRAGSESESEPLSLSCLEIAATVGLAITSSAVDALPAVDASEAEPSFREVASR